MTTSTSSHRPLGGSIGDAWAQVCARHGERPALSSPSLRATYAELDRRVRVVAARLAASLGDEPAAVAVMAAHDGPLVVTLLGVLVAGHTVVVLDPTAPPAVTGHALVESGAAVVVVDADSAPTVEAALAAAGIALRVETTTAVGADGDAGITDGPAPTFDAPTRHLDDPAMLAFTSGTSGTPKAAVITHGLILNLVRGATDALDITERDRMPMLFPLSMAVAAYPLFLPLLNGGTLATLDVRSVGFGPVSGFLRDEGITLAYLAPTVVRFLTDAVEGATFPDLRMVALGGEGIDRDAVELTRHLFGVGEVGLGYGTTETGVVCLQVLRSDDPAPAVVACGRAVPDVEVVALDHTGRRCGVGEAGEVAIVSPHLFSGYLVDGAVDRSQLEDDPDGRPGWFRYRTGDLGHLTAAGELVIAGRVDTKVKVRGQFVNVGDVEAALHQLEGITDAIVVPIRRGGITDLAAVVAGRGDPTGWRARMLAEHPPHHVPTRWVEVDELPRLPNGKLDRRGAQSLAEAAGARPGSATTVRRGPTRDAVAATLTDVWHTLLGPRTVGDDLDFFHAGGDSLLAAQMVILVEQRLGVTLPMGVLVNARTFGDIAEEVRRLVTTAVPLAAVVQEGSGDRPPLWFVHDLQGSAFRVRHVAAALGPDQGVWSFESPLLAGEPNRFDTLDDLAAAYVDDLVRVQPDGPVHLAGYSFGGVCAFEMARQLRAAGREVGFVGVVDVGPGYRGPGWRGRRSPFRPWFGVAKPPEPGTPLRGVVDHYVTLARQGPDRFARHLLVRSGAYRFVDPWRFRRDLAVHGRVRPAWRLWYAWEEHWRLATKAWDRARRFPGTIDVFRADDTPATDEQLGWGPLAERVVVHRFTGDHFGILEERGAPALARVLRHALDERLAVTPTDG